MSMFFSYQGSKRRRDYEEPLMPLQKARKNKRKSSGMFRNKVLSFLYTVSVGVVVLLAIGLGLVLMATPFVLLVKWIF